MPEHAELRSGMTDSELLPCPPAITRRVAASEPAVDDGLPMPPFSRVALRLPVPDVPSTVVAEVEASPVPADPRRILAEEVASRLESLAGDLRQFGFHALLEPRSEQEPIDVVLAAVVAGFLARR